MTYVNRGYVNQRRFSITGRRRPNPKHGEWWGSAWDRELDEERAREFDGARAFAESVEWESKWTLPDDAPRPRVTTGPALVCSAPGFNVRITL